MPTLDISELNIIATVLGVFTVLYGLIAVKLKRVWYLGEALPAVFIGILLGPAAARFLDTTRWISAGSVQQDSVTLGVMRVMIGIQLVIAGYQLPGRYLRLRAKEMLVCLFPIMTFMWLATTACVLATIPKMTVLLALTAAACVTSTDPVLSQAVAKGPFSDKYVARPLREMISAEAGANDGFASPFLMLGVSLMLHRKDAAKALRFWVVETWLYTVALAIAYGTLVGHGARKAVELSLARRWIDSESYLLFPTALALFVVGTCGAIGTSDLLACFVAGCVLNWDGQFYAETRRRHDEVNSCIDVLLNYGGFMYIGITIPWDQFQQPEVTGITWPRLIGLGFLVLFLRRIPALLVCYKIMPAVVKNWKEAVFMGYFGPVGVGAIYYLEHTRILFLNEDSLDPSEENLLAALTPVVYFLALFSIVVHGLSIPALDAVYSFYRVREVHEDAEQIRRRSIYVATPANAVAADDDTFIAYNRFPRPEHNTDILPHFRRHTGTSHSDLADESVRTKRRGTAPGHLHIPHMGPVGGSST